MANLFGFSLGKDRAKVRDDRKQAVVSPTPDDGAAIVSTGGFYGTYLDLDATAKSESELITRYREASLYPECDTAIEEIVTDAIAVVDDEEPVTIDLDSVPGLSPAIKQMIQAEFENILRLLAFKGKGHDLFRRWYIDGRLYHQKLIDEKNPKRGILELRYIDPRKIRKVRDVKREMNQDGIEIVTTVEEFFLYNEKGINYVVGNYTNQNSTSGVKISPDAISYIHSGLIDPDKNVVMSYMHKAIKPVNQLKMMEDSLVIYRISRAPERRIFYIDVGNLSKQKGEQYMKSIMDKYRNKIVYDSATGEIRDDRKFMSILEDYWLPRRGDGRGTEITTLDGGDQLSQLDDVVYFQNKLYKSLNVPVSRLTAESGLNFGRQAEISRDELKFAKFVSRLRAKFSLLFDDLLRTQLVLKGVIAKEDWEYISENIYYRFAVDNSFQELKELEEWRNRIDLVNQMQPFIGSMFSQQFIFRNIMRMSDDQIINMKNEIMEEQQIAMQQEMAAQQSQTKPRGQKK